MYVPGTSLESWSLGFYYVSKEFFGLDKDIKVMTGHDKDAVVEPSRCLDGGSLFY